jgi:hypothetical protein
VWDRQINELCLQTNEVIETVTKAHPEYALR